MTPERILDLQDELEDLFLSKGCDQRFSHSLAFEVARRIDRKLNPRVSHVAKVNIEDTYKKNKKILITISNKVDADPNEVLEEYLSRTKGYPAFDKWRVEERTGAPGFPGTPFLCTVLPKEKPKTKPKRTGKRKKSKASFLKDVKEMDPQEQAEFIEQLKKRAADALSSQKSA